MPYDFVGNTPSGRTLLPCTKFRFLGRAILEAHKFCIFFSIGPLDGREKISKFFPTKIKKKSWEISDLKPIWAYEFGFLALWVVYFLVYSFLGKIHADADL